MGKIGVGKLGLVKQLYYDKKLGMRETAERLGVSIDAVTYFMRRHGLYRRNLSEVQRHRFERKKPSFSTRPRLSKRAEELRVAGAMLYWGEGYKAEKSSGVDFANSDPTMIRTFLEFLRSVYDLDESRFRVFLYCYFDQNTAELISFWSALTHIPKKQFSKPYIRKDFRSEGRKMKHGLVHIRYGDKKLLLEIKRLIAYYTQRFTKSSRR